MRRIKLTVAYDGTNYCGWQIQPNAVTIEGLLDKAIFDLTNEQIHVIGASRTDAGVHAYGAVAVFDTQSVIPASKFAYALNVRLPKDIRIRKSEEVDTTWHPRKVDVKKTYEYTIWHDEFEMPNMRLYSHHVYGELDIEAMKKAACYFVGEHDFCGFCSAHNQTETTVRTIYSLEVMQGDDPRVIRIRVTGNGFLYNMVRIIAGTLIEVGRAKITPDDIPSIIESGDRSKAGDTAPAKGLVLVGYEYL